MSDFLEQEVSSERGEPARPRPVHSTLSDQYYFLSRRCRLTEGGEGRLRRRRGIPFVIFLFYFFILRHYLTVLCLRKHTFLLDEWANTPDHIQTIDLKDLSSKHPKIRERPADVVWQSPEAKERTRLGVRGTLKDEAHKIRDYTVIFYLVQHCPNPQQGLCKGQKHGCLEDRQIRKDLKGRVWNWRSFSNII